MAANHDIELVQGKTFTDILRWEVPPIVRVAIASISTDTGAPRITTKSPHGLVDGWRCVVVGAKGLTDLNPDDPQKIRDSDYQQATRIDDTIIELNEVNAAEFKAHTPNTGFVQFNTPASLVGLSARMSIKAVAGEYNLLRCKTAGTSGSVKPSAAGTDGTVVWEATALPATKEWSAATAFAAGDVIDTKALLFLSTTNGRIVIDTAAKTIKRTIPASVIAAATWKTGYYDLEAYTADSEPVVTLLDYGRITVGKEQTK